jgi:hypothetical protein
MRQFLAALAAVVLIAPAVDAQSSGDAPRRPPPPPPTVPVAPRTVPPPIVFPFAPLSPPPAGGLMPRFGENPPFRTRMRAGAPFGVSGYAPFLLGDLESTYRAADNPPRSTAPSTGLLRLAVTPTSAQVFVDSFYVGTVEDIDAQRVLQLDAGPHRLEFRAPDRQTLTVDVRIVALETVTYRAALEPIVRPRTAAAPSAAPTTVMYVIPNCYLGNLPPRQSRLPSGCDVKQVRVLKPGPAAVQP